MTTNDTMTDNELRIAVAKKRRVRNRAKSIKKYLGFECKVCSFNIGIVAHHIRPVADGGDSDPFNLIKLCPNCHAVVHELPQSAHRGINKYRMSTLRKWYSDEQIALLLSIRRGTVIAKLGEYWCDVEWRADHLSAQYVAAYDERTGSLVKPTDLPTLEATIKALSNMGQPE